MINKLSLLIFIFVLSIADGYAANCGLLNNHNGLNGFIEFKCDQDISLKENKLVFYIIGKNTKINNITIDGAKTDYGIDQISTDIKRVELNILTKGIFLDSDFTAFVDKPVRLNIKSKKDANLDYKILWGGVVKNSYKKQKSKTNNLQLYRDKFGQFFAYKRGLKCSVNDNCKDTINIYRTTSKSNNTLGHFFSTYLNFGIAHQSQT